MNTVVLTEDNFDEVARGGNEDLVKELRNRIKWSSERDMIMFVRYDDTFVQAAYIAEQFNDGKNDLLEILEDMDVWAEENSTKMPK